MQCFTRQLFGGNRGQQRLGPVVALRQQFDHAWLQLIGQDAEFGKQQGARPAGRTVVLSAVIMPASRSGSRASALSQHRLGGGQHLRVAAGGQDVECVEPLRVGGGLSPGRSKCVFLVMRIRRSSSSAASSRQSCRSGESWCAISLPQCRQQGRLQHCALRSANRVDSATPSRAARRHSSRVCQRSSAIRLANSRARASAAWGASSKRSVACGSSRTKPSLGASNCETYRTKSALRSSNNGQQILPDDVRNQGIGLRVLQDATQHRRADRDRRSC